ncbi:MAG: Ig-like domain-containing protein, partial [Deltaproteobacteria bacterium]|nr:Ig-like domain-containing protein [Deltaproteobacteria bacterium]
MVRVEGLLALVFILCAACGTEDDTDDTDEGFCGDGVTDPGEECDDGEDNTDSCAEPGCEYCTTDCESEMTPDDAPPLVVSTGPTVDEETVAVDATVSVTFSEAMDDATITDATFLVDSDEGSVEGTVTATTDTATFT